MADIFNRVITLGSVISGDLLRITFGTNQGGMIPQLVQIAQERAVSVGMDPGSGNLYQVLGIPQLALVTIRGLITDAATYKSFISTYGTGCSTGSDLVISVTTPVCDSTQTVSYTLKSPRIIRYGAVVSGENYIFVSDIVLGGVAIEVA